MKNSRDSGFDQHYNAQIAVEQKTLLIVSTRLSNHPNDFLEGLPTVDAISPSLGKPKRAALDNGYFSHTNIEGFRKRKIEPYIATGRQSHHSDLKTLCAEPLLAPDVNASPKIKMAYELQTEEGKSFYRLRKCTAEPVIGIIKETMRFRQFSLRGLAKVAGEWNLGCLAFNFKRLHRLKNPLSPTGC
jgi:hypothetical protein